MKRAKRQKKRPIPGEEAFNEVAGRALIHQIEPPRQGSDFMKWQGDKPITNVPAWPASTHAPTRRVTKRQEFQLLWREFMGPGKVKS